MIPVTSIMAFVQVPPGCFQAGNLQGTITSRLWNDTDKHDNNSGFRLILE